MESESKKKGTAIIIVLLVIVIIGLIGFIVYDKIIVNKTKTDNISKTETKSISHKSGNLYKNASDMNIICSTDSKTPYVIGTKYICNNLGDGKSYTFYVLNDATNSEKVDLIMNKDYAKSTYFELSANGSID